MCCFNLAESEALPFRQSSAVVLGLESAGEKLQMKLFIFFLKKKLCWGFLIFEFLKRNVDYGTLSRKDDN